MKISMHNHSDVCLCLSLLLFILVKFLGQRCVIKHDRELGVQKSMSASALRVLFTVNTWQNITPHLIIVVINFTANNPCQSLQSESSEASKF